MSYTKGPWTADDTSVKCGRNIIASVFDPDDTCHRTPIGVANALLIAAAPDMYEALKAMLGKAYKQNWNDQYPDQVALAEAALTKAEGK